MKKSPKRNPSTADLRADLYALLTLANEIDEHWQMGQVATRHLILITRFKVALVAGIHGSGLVSLRWYHNGHGLKENTAHTDHVKRLEKAFGGRLKPLNQKLKAEFNSTGAFQEEVEGRALSWTACSIFGVFTDW